MKQSAIIWPNDYLPGTTDNFASNEIFVAGLSAKRFGRSSTTPPCGRTTTATPKISVFTTAAARR